MKDEYYIAHKKDMDKFFAVQKEYCSECGVICDWWQEKKCLDIFWSIAIEVNNGK
jgi:hypothetical protein